MKERRERREEKKEERRKEKNRKERKGKERKGKEAWTKRKGAKHSSKHQRDRFNRRKKEMPRKETIIRNRQDEDSPGLQQRVTTRHSIITFFAPSSFLSVFLISGKNNTEKLKTKGWSICFANHTQHERQTWTPWPAPSPSSFRPGNSKNLGRMADLSAL